MSTEIKTKKTRTQQILDALHVVAWLAFIGYAINAGTVMVSYIISCNNPAADRNLFTGIIDVYPLKGLSMANYTAYASFVVVIFAMKSYVWLLVTKALKNINLINPFKMEVVRLLERISYVLLEIWIVGVIGDSYAVRVLGIGKGLLKDSYTQEFLFMAGLIFIISQIYKRGVELQSENDLTV